MEHYVGTAAKSGEPQIRYSMPEGSVEGKDVLIIDDIADTGGSISHAYEYVTDRNAGEVRTATLQLLGTSEFEPEYVSERLEAWSWIVYPWNFIEDMTELIAGVAERSEGERIGEEEIRHLLREYHDIERIEMEITQPGRLEEVLDEMVRRGTLERTGPEEWRLLDADA
jgi:hypoxanthine phosphoribosyltransferase